MKRRPSNRIAKNTQRKATMSATKLAHQVIFRESPNRKKKI